MIAMQLPMTGSWAVEVKTVRPFTIHGDLYWELRAARLDEGGHEVSLRVPQHAAKSEPIVGQHLTVGFLMGQVTVVTLIG